MDWNILTKRLTGKGISGTNISAYLRDVANSLDSREEIDLWDLNNRLRRLGWDEFDLDDHTLQLIIANMEKLEQEKKGVGKFFLYEKGREFNEISRAQPL